MSYKGFLYRGLFAIFIEDEQEINVAPVASQAE